MSKASRRRARAKRMRNKALMNNQAAITADQAVTAATEQNNTNTMNLSEAQNMNIDISDNVWFEVGYLDSDKLVKDTYQRPTDPTRVKDIVDKFDPALVNLLKISFRDGC